MRPPRLAALAAVLLLAACVVPPPPPPPPPTTGLPPGTWTATFDESFSGPGHPLATSADWNTGQGTYSFNGGREWYADCKVTVSGGTAKLEAAPYPDPTCSNPNRTDPPEAGPHEGYLSGFVGTNRPLSTSPHVYKFRYGYVEARLKLPPQTPGFFSAFWMLDATPIDSYSYDNEIDVLEVLGGDATSVWQTSHTQPDRSVTYSTMWYDQNGACPDGVRYDDGFHTYGVDWEPGFIAFYIDGQECGRVDAGVDPSFVSPTNDMYVILNLFVDHGWETSWGGYVTPTDGVWPTRTLEVDYLRVWQH